MIFILGAKGFVGSAFVRYCERMQLEHVPIDLDNYDASVGQRCDLLINAAGSSSKRLALTDPLHLLDRNVRDTVRSLIDFRAARYVYLSSCDVYYDCSSPALTGESALLRPAKMSRYGVSKYMGELVTQAHARDWVIFRLGGMVGPNLRKNAIYDLTHGGKLYVHPKSAYQYLHTDDVARLIVQLAQDLRLSEVLNLCGDGAVELSLVQGWLGQQTLPSGDLPCERYEVDIARARSHVSVPSSITAVRQYIQAVREQSEGD